MCAPREIIAIYFSFIFFDFIKNSHSIVLNIKIKHSGSTSEKFGFPLNFDICFGVDSRYYTDPPRASYALSVIVSVI